MSYLNALRLHFAGQFQANISTVNNTAGNFDNQNFVSADLQLNGNGGYSPQGDGTFRLIGCKVTTAWLPSGQIMAPDTVLTSIVADSDGRVPAKMVDLDTEQQLVSEIWGLEVRIADGQGNSLMTGEFDPAAFIDIWSRATDGGPGGDTAMAATYQSVLLNLQWFDVSASPFLTALQQASASSGLLSIKFNVDGFDMDNTSPTYMCGRIVGTIGPATITEPRHLVVGRQFMTGANSPQINFCAAVIDQTSQTMYLDLGNALMTTVPGGPISPIGDLVLTVPGTTLGTIYQSVYSVSGWYLATAGVVPVILSAAGLQAASAAPITITAGSVSIAEWPSGAYVRADRFVYRLSPMDVAKIPVYAMQWGQALAAARIGFTYDNSGLQQQIYQRKRVPVGIPTDALTYNTVATTDAHGVAIIDLTARDPGTPRWFNNGTEYGIDGQVYGIRPAFTDTVYSGPVNSTDYPIDPSNFISLLVWSAYAPSNPVTWADLQPIMQQYANLYPVMGRFLDLSDCQAVVRHARMLTLAFGLDTADPNSMPVTRDLSPAKRAAILAWLQNPQCPPTISTASAVAQPATAGPAGTKTEALARRLVSQNP